MKKQLLMATIFALVGVFTVNSMQGEDYTLYFKRLGFRPDDKLTTEGIKAAHAKRTAELKKITDKDLVYKQQFELFWAEHYLSLIRLVRAKRNNTHTKKVISRVNTGIFTQQVKFEEKDPNFGLKCTYQINDYNYKRIIGALGLVGTTLGGLAYWYRNELSSLIKPIFNSVFLKSTL